MSTIDNIISVQLTLQTTSPQQAGFGVPLVLGNSQAILPDYTRTYDSASALSSMVADGYATTDLEYIAVSKLISQQNRPPQVKVGRRDNPVTQALVLTVPDAVNGKDYTVTINGTDYTVTGDGVLTATDIAGDLEDLITAASITNLTATDNVDGTFDLDAASGAMFQVAVTNVNLDDQTTDANFASDIAALVDEDNAWYFLINTCQSAASITAASAWVESNKKLYGWSSGDSDVIAAGSSDILSTMQALNYKRSFGVWSHDPAQFMEAAWIGKVAPTDPGSNTWKFQTLTGVSASPLTATQKGRITSKGGNYYNTVKGISYTTEGWTVGGDFIDVTRGVDWWLARVQERIFSRLINEPKVPGTDEGIAVIENEIRAQNQEAIGQNVFAADPAPLVLAPKQADRSTADKAARALTGIIVNATLAGAIHSVSMSATISV